MFLPTTKEEIDSFGWDELDVVLVSGDTYIDSPYIGIAVIGNYLYDLGFRVGIIAQPKPLSEDIARLGEPKLFWGVSGGSVDSMVANYTASKKRRKRDDYTPGGVNDRRPDRAVIAYTNLIKKHFKNTAPIVLGGLEASLRRIAHYDFWSNKIRRSILFDAKADILIYGMGERAVGELAFSLKNKTSYKDIRGICYIDKEPKEGFVELPSFEEVGSSKDAYAKSFELFYENNDPLNAKGLYQNSDSRYLIQNPPAYHLSEDELDRVYELPYRRDTHPHYKRQGEVKALETIRFSITTHRGCYGECSFCAIALHQGRAVLSRSQNSIIKEAEIITKLDGFKGYIDDVGGPTANMYGYECDKKMTKGVCKNKPCIGVTKCKTMPISHKKQIELLKELRGLDGVKKVFVRSGIRYDLILNDKIYGEKYLEEIVKHHISGQLKIAPEHTDEGVLKLMNKPTSKALLEFKKLYERLNTKNKKRQFLTYYFIAAHPGCDITQMQKLKNFTTSKLHSKPEQIQIFTPTPSTKSTLMYYTQKDPTTKKPLFVEKDMGKKLKQKDIFFKNSF
ncbi:MAG: YgiQ family radical SAM protein [Campylobacterales bacterium]